MAITGGAILFRNSDGDKMCMVRSLFSFAVDLAETRVSGCVTTLFYKTLPSNNQSSLLSTDNGCSTYKDSLQS